MPVFFSLEGAKQEMGVAAEVEACLDEARADYQQANPDTSLRVVHSERETLWYKLDHLLYLPILGLTRPRDL